MGKMGKMAFFMREKMLGIGKWTEVFAHDPLLHTCISPKYSNIFFSESDWPIKAKSKEASIGGGKESLRK